MGNCCRPHRIINWGMGNLWESNIKENDLEDAVVVRLYGGIYVRRMRTFHLLEAT